MKIKILLSLLCLSFSSNILAISTAAKKKYPHSLISNDYDILNEKDLGHYTKIFPPKPFSEKGAAGFIGNAFLVN